MARRAEKTPSRSAPPPHRHGRSPFGTEVASAKGMPANKYNAVLRERAHRVVRPVNPLADPLAHVKQPLSTKLRGRAKVEFIPSDIRMIRAKFLATQRDFARLIGISVETLRNWERGRRRPHGPARALLRAIGANPIALARALNWHAGEGRPEPDEWLEE